MKKILVPCDFSEPSVQAFKFAVELATKSNGTIELLHIIELPVLHDTVLMPTLSFEEVFIKDAKASAEKNFAKLVNKYAKDGPEVFGNVAFGPVMSSIEEISKEKKIDLIVMGTHGASGFKEFFVGSNTEKIVRRADVPVIAVKKSTKISSIKNIVFPIVPDMDLESLTMKVKQLQNFFGANLHVVYVNTPGLFRKSSEILPELKKFAKRFMLKDCTTSIYNDIDEEEGIRNFVKEVKGDLIAMATHGRRGIGRLMTGSIAEDVVNHIDCPIWTAKLH